MLAKFSAAISQYSITNAKEVIYWDYWFSALSYYFLLLKKLFPISCVFESNTLISVQLLLNARTASDEMNCMYEMNYMYTMYIYM